MDDTPSPIPTTGRTSKQLSKLLLDGIIFTIDVHNDLPIIADDAAISDDPDILDDYYEQEEILFADALYQTHEALAQLFQIIRHSRVELDEWPLAFADTEHAERFLAAFEWLSDASILDDDEARLFRKYLSQGDMDTDDLSLDNGADAARVLRQAKEEYFDRGIRFGCEDPAVVDNKSFT